MNLVQVAYVVDDVRAAALEWHCSIGTGPFVVKDHASMEYVRIPSDSGRDEEAVFDHSMALGQWGGVMLELVAHHEVSPRRLELAMRRDDPGVHHVACFVDDLAVAREQIEARGGEVVLDGSTGRVHFLFMRPGVDAGHLIELYEPSDYLLGAYEKVRSASVGWDGSDVIRELG